MAAAIDREPVPQDEGHDAALREPLRFVDSLVIEGEMFVSAAGGKMRMADAGTCGFFGQGKTVSVGMFVAADSPAVRCRAVPQGQHGSGGRKRSGHRKAE